VENNTGIYIPQCIYIISERIRTHWKRENLCGRLQHYCIRFLWQSFHNHGKCNENNVLFYGITWCILSFFAYIIVSKNECAAFNLIRKMYVKVRRNWSVESVPRVSADSTWQYLPTLEYGLL
jgi:hypothetical protein